MKASSSLSVPSPRVLVIGGGVAGSVCALVLARRGVPVDVAEKMAFPRPKVCGCCIGGAGLAALESLSLRESVERVAATTRRWSASFSGRRIDLPLANGIAVSRHVLDPLLLQVAAESGAQVLQPCGASIIDADHRGVRVALQQEAEAIQREYDLVICAAGLSMAGLNEYLPWTETPNGPFGVSCRLQTGTADPGTIYMACGSDGYVGMVRLADGSIDVAAALRSGSESAKAGVPLVRMQRLLATSGFDPGHWDTADELRTTPPLRRSRRFAEGRLLAIGDTAGYVEPFTGEGMTWAIQSGIAAAELVSDCPDWDTLAGQWRTRLRDLLRGKKRICRMVTDALHHDGLRGPAAVALSRVPWLASPLLKALGQR
ncbi:NAD(P)/FAD-dependent oxidoreductase [Roseiconus nitratireducens]|uniref:NAD(P)/FAD-dependent oxidoreductase n=1 Tax=Roseiconus nitratireducens TaxID=2605748 RepID=A0A5M6CW66_9BACT|nr:NAD(P)/FAD-dependent oxidoreductase [Roseiconus nitratireducens]KAA5539333.1 NAD(P)/FAD-dependent oxidoreductase [Roseiconus nitratireducens]